MCMIVAMLFLVCASGNASTSAIRGSVSSMVQTAKDGGPVARNLVLPNVHVYYAPTAAQMQELQQLIADQRTASSSQYHKWLTPEEFAERFGMSASDEVKIKAWLSEQGISNVTTSKSRTSVVFSATASQAESAFHTQIHALTVQGKSNYANVSEISVPSSVVSVVRSVRGLDSFRPNASPRMKAQFTWGNSSYELAPGDIATIYNIASLHSAGITGSGVTVAVIGQSDIDLTDIAAYRSGFNLPASTPKVVLASGSSDPGTYTTDETEADLDLELISAVAPGASLVYVNSTDATLSLEYAIEQNLGQVISMSYGSCETADTLASQQALAYYVAEANSQGQTIVAASGDTGAAGCDSAVSTAAQYGLSVTSPANQPGVTGVGGTSFSSVSGYFGTTNDSKGGSAVSYIPEIAWNLTSSQNHLEASGGGASTYFAKPGWQQGTGVPTDGQRDVPDVAFFAGDSALNDSTAYVICTQGDCASGTPNMTTSGGAVGGTSAAAPVFSGIVALLNNYLVTNGSITSPGLGNINPTLYLMANNTSTVFHQITQGNNIVPCTAGSTNCPSGGSFGYSANTGYNQVTGLGSVDAYAMATAWNSYKVGSTSTALTTSEATIVYGTPITLTAKVVDSTASSTPSGTVTFYSYAGQVSTLSVLGTAQLDSTGSASLTLSSGLAEDVSMLRAAYSGSAEFSESLSPSISVYQPTTTTVSSSSSQVALGSTVSLTASVAGITSSTTGTVSFYAGSTLLGTASVSNASASITTSALPVGANSVTAVYSGSTYYSGSTSSAVQITVTVVAANTTTTLSTSAAQATSGSSVTLTATVVAATGSAAGTVNFYNGTGLLGTGTLSSGVATFTTSSLPVGTNWIKATYVGTTDYATSTSGSVSVVVLQPSFTLSASPSSVSVTGGSTASSSLTITPVNGFNSTLSFSCSGLPAGSSCTFGNPVTQSNGTMTVAVKISTQALTASVANPMAVGGPVLAILPLFGMLAIMKRRKVLAAALLAVFTAVLTFGTTGCGGKTTTSTTTTTTPVTSTITVTATAASGNTQNTQITLTVN
jgi:subtilase family serine protease